MKNFFCSLSPGKKPNSVEILFRAELTKGMFRKGWPSRRKILIDFIAQCDSQVKVWNRSKAR